MINSDGDGRISQKVAFPSLWLSRLGGRARRLMRSADKGSIVAELTMQDVEWFAERGHPLLVLGDVGRPNQSISVAHSVGDARSLALTPTSEGFERVRLFALVETIINKMGGSLREAEFGVGPSRTLGATLHIDTVQGPLTLSANFADAVALACRAGIRMTISETQLALAFNDQPSNFVEPRNSANTVQRFIETLDLGWIDGSGFPPINE
jgi:hypothetical protein